MQHISRQQMEILLNSKLLSMFKFWREKTLRHSFVTMADLADVINTSIYADTAFELMTVSPFSYLYESDNFLEAEIAAQDDSGNKDSDDPKAYYCDHSNTALRAHTLRCRRWAWQKLGHWEFIWWWF